MVSARTAPTPNGARRRHVAVVGGGIAGLAAAWFLREHSDQLGVTVLEGSSQLGGKLRVSEVAGIPVDEAAEAILNRRPEAVELARAVGLDADVRYPATTAAGVWSYGTVRPLPTTTVMGVPADLDAVRDSGVVSDAGVLRAREDLIRRGEPVVGDVAIGRYAARRLGREVVERLVEPLLGGVYAGHADELSLDATVPALAPYVRAGGSLVEAARQVHETARSTDEPVFAGLDGGVGRLATSVADELERRGVTLRTEAMVRGLTRRAGGWRLTVGAARAPEAVDADAVVLACPATPASRLLTVLAPHAAADLADIPYASVAVVTAAFPATGFPRTVTGSGFLVPPVERRVVKAVTYASRKWAWLERRASDLVAVRCSVGRHREETDLQYDDRELAQRALADLADLVGVTGEPVDTRVSRWGGSLPQYTVGHRQRIERIRAAVAALPGLAVCGAAYDGLGIPACIASARAAVSHLVSSWTSSTTG